MKKVLTIALCALFAGAVAAAPAKKPAEPLAVAAETPAAEQDCTKLEGEAKAKCEAEKAAADEKKEEKKAQ